MLRTLATLHCLRRHAYAAAILCGLIFCVHSAMAGSADLEAGQRLVEQLSLADWMGPLAPIALSPFFGLMCLSGAALLVERGWLPAHPLLSGNPALCNEPVFITLLALAVFTSLPRLTKVTKPVAQLADFLETYAAMVYLLVIFWATRGRPTTAESLLFMASGFADAGGWTGIAIVTVINILVIQTIRLFFEMLVWLSPFPLVDAAFEAANKTICAGLIAVYAFNPPVALAINLVLFALCALFVRAAFRRLRAFRRDVLIPIGKKTLRWLRRTNRHSDSSSPSASAPLP